MIFYPLHRLKVLLIDEPLLNQPAWKGARFPAVCCFGNETKGEIGMFQRDFGEKTEFRRQKAEGRRQKADRLVCLCLPISVLCLLISVFLMEDHPAHGDD
jgi:hypothetical protein